jgi:hypothetical protein
MGQCPYRDKIDACFGDCSNGFESDAPGCFCLVPPTNAINRNTELVECEIVEHDAVKASNC